MAATTSDKPESLVVQLGQHVEKGEGRAVQQPVRRRRWFLHVHRQSSVEQLQTQLYVKGASTWKYIGADRRKYI